jgi:O-antigen/teichoic acid export membrane protein
MKPGAIGRNIAANGLAGGWIVVLSLAVVPVQVGILGVEAYGVIGVLAMLQTVFPLLDLGLCTTLMQRAAADDTRERTTTRHLARAATAVFLLTAVAAGLVLALNADWLAAHWLRIATLPPATVAAGLQLIVIAVVLRCPVTVCAALISGLNRLDALNLLRAGMQSLRLLGGVLVLVIYRELLPLLWWEVAVTVLESAAYLTVSRRLLPALSLWPCYSAEVMRSQWRFALELNAVAVIGLTLTQFDKLAISATLPLESLGTYYLAYSATAWLTLLQGGFNSAILPSFAADFSGGRRAQLRSRNAKITQITVYVVALPAAAILFFGTEILGSWVGREAAVNAAPVAALLSGGFLLNAAVSNCLTLAIAGGNSGIPLRVNLLGLVIYLPALALLLDTHGIAGAALAWVILNAYYLVVLVPIVQRRLLQQGFGIWVCENFLPFVLLAGVLFGGMCLLNAQLESTAAWLTWGLMAAAAIAYALGGFFLLARELRENIAASAAALLRTRRA